MAPDALHAAAGTIDRMTLHIRPDIPGCLASAGAELAIIPKDEFITALPEFAWLEGMASTDGRAYESFEIRGQGAVKGQPVSVASEENLLGLPGDNYSHVEVTVDVFAQAIQNLCFTDEDYAALATLYDTARQGSAVPGASVDAFLATFTESAFFSTFTTAYFGAIDALPGVPRAATPQLLRQFLPEIYAFMDGFYNAEPD